MIKTVSLTAGTETKVEISGGYNVGVINRTTDMLYASKNSGISAGADDVAAIPAGDNYTIRAADDTVYLLATAAGDVQLESIGAKEVFKVAATRTSSGGGEGGTVDEVARQAIASHANNGAIHLTAEKAIKAVATVISNDNLLDNPDLSINQRGEESWSPAGEQQVYTVDRWYAAKCIVNKLGGGISLAWNGTDGDSGWIQQKIPTTELFGKVVTISADLNGERHSVTATVPTTSDKTVGGAANEDGSILFAVSNHGNNLMSVVVFSKVTTPITIENIKLELGSQATPFLPPEPATELAKCQRYYQGRTSGDIDPADLRPSMAEITDIVQREDGKYAYIAAI